MRVTDRPAADGETRLYDLTFRFWGGQSNQDRRRRPKTKYEVGRTPAELMSATVAAHTRFRPRI